MRTYFVDCDGRVYDPNRVCSKTDGIFRSTNKLTTLVDYKVLSDSWTSDAQGTIGTSVVKQKHTPCRDNTVKHPTKVRLFNYIVDLDRHTYGIYFFLIFTRFSS